MVLCAEEEGTCGEVLGYEVPCWTALALHRVVPACGGLVVYLCVLCYDLALLLQHYQSGDTGLAACCLLLLLLPALLALVFTLAAPPPADDVTFTPADLYWIGKQLLNFVFFPFTTIGRYCHQIFWWTEAACAAWSLDKTRTRAAIGEATAPSPLELYLFLQAFVHSAPLSIVSIVDLMRRAQDPHFQKVSVQAASIIAASLRMAAATTTYRRFQRRKIQGERYPWQPVPEEKLAEDNHNGEVEPDGPDKETGENIYEPLRTQISVNSQKAERRNISSDLIQFSPTKPKLFFDKTPSNSESSLEQYELVFRSESARKFSKSSDDEYIKPISIIERVAPYRRDTHPAVQYVYVPPPPSVPAPRPGSLAIWAERIVENAESIPAWLSAPPRRRHVEITHDEPDVPRAVPRSYIRGLEPDDLAASLVHCLGWYAFFVSRLLSISAFIDFFPFAAIIILFCHYQVMLLFLIVPQAPTVKRGFYIFLAFIYLFCIMEFKIRFRHVRVWHTFWFVVCTIETLVFTSVWALVNNGVGEFWRDFVVQVVCVSMLLGFVCFLFYFAVLQPKETLVYIQNKVELDTMEK